jgi:hypothetical protein
MYLQELNKANAQNSSETKYQPSIKEVEGEPFRHVHDLPELHRPAWFLDLLLQRMARSHAILHEARLGEVEALSVSLAGDVDINYTGAFKVSSLTVSEAIPGNWQRMQYF